MTAGGRYLSVPGVDVPILLASANRAMGPYVVGVRTATALRPGTTGLGLGVGALRARGAWSGAFPTRATLTLGQGQEAVLEAGGVVTVRRQFVVALNGQAGRSRALSACSAAPRTRPTARSRGGARTRVLAVRF